MPRKTIKLGDRATDQASGFTGIVTAIARYLGGHNRMLLTRPAHISAPTAAERWFDAGRIAPASVDDSADEHPQGKAPPPEASQQSERAAVRITP